MTFENRTCREASPNQARGSAAGGAILKFVASKGQLDLLGNDFETARPANALFCHQEFLEKLAEHSRDPIGRRSAFLLQRLAVGARLPELASQNSIRTRPSSSDRELPVNPAFENGC